MGGECKILIIISAFLFMASHCLICGSAIGGGLYCKDCEWEITKIRLGSEEDFENWFNFKLQEYRSIIIDENKYNKIDRFQ